MGAIVFGVLQYAPAEDPPVEPVTVSEQDIQTLIQSLDAPEFRRRESAMQQLTALGQSVIDRVAEAGCGSSLETGMRAVAILGTLYESRDLEAVDAAGHGLDRIVAEAPQAVAQQALAMLEKNRFTVRQKRAVEAVRKMGGQVNLETERAVVLDGRAIRPPGGWVRYLAIDREWTGGDEGLKHVAQLDTLMVLYLVSGHPLSSEAIAKLELELPEMEVQYRGAAFLGVATQPDALGCMITQIRAGTAAEQAGLVQGDVVLEIAGQGVRAPEDLIRIIGGYGPGETVDMTILRGEPLERFALVDQLSERDSFSPVLAIALMQQMRRQIPVTLGTWKIDSAVPTP